MGHELAMPADHLAVDGMPADPLRLHDHGLVHLVAGHATDQNFSLFAHRYFFS
jgi:hypothetical protein